MIKLLLRLFVPHYQDAESPAVRSAIGKLSGAVGIACNLLLFAGKLVIGILAGSVSITADALNNLSDATSSIVTLLGFKLAEKPADEDHPYGHARFEYLSGLAVAALIIVIGFELAKSSVEKILSPTPLAISVPLVVVLGLSILIKLWMAACNRFLGNHIKSGTLLATAADSRNDVIATGAVLLSALLESLTHWQLDGWVGLGVALFILYSGVDTAKTTISPLLGEAASPELRRIIVKTITQDDRVLGYHDLMVHDYGPGQRFASLHVEMDQREDPILCHEIIDDLERACLEQHNVHLVIHYDPIVTDDPEQNTLRELIQSALTAFDERLTLHDFRMVRGKGHTNLIFDVSLPNDLKKQESTLRTAVKKALDAHAQGTYHAVITFDPEAFN